MTCLRVRLQVPILFNLSEPQRFQLAQKMVQRDVAAGEVVLRQGDQGACMRRQRCWLCTRLSCLHEQHKQS